MTKTISETREKKSFRPRVLIVDHEQENRSIVSRLISDHYFPLEAGSGPEAISAAKREKPSLILMDIMMPEMDGIEVCERLRNDYETKHIPIIIVTAANQRENRIKCFSEGADDFIPKPFDPEELLARISSKLRRANERPSKIRYLVKNLRMEKDEQIVFVDEIPIQLTHAESGILKILMQFSGKIVSRSKIMESVWRDQNLEDRVIDAHMTSLRNKLASFKESIKSVYGKGYILS